MARPIVSEAAEEIYSDLPAFALLDPPEYLLLILVAAICGPAIDPIHELVTDTEERPGWQLLFDPAKVPAQFIAWLAQPIGARLEPLMSEAEQRAALIDPEARGRGTIEAIAAAARRRLSGSKTVKITERYTGKPWRILIETDEAETPDPAGSLADILAAKPIGLLLFFNARATWTWEELETEVGTYPTWASIEESFLTWNDFSAHEP